MSERHWPVTATLVAWNEAPRLKPLLKHLRPFFDTIVVGVQQSEDATQAIAELYADKVVTDRHHGYGDATYGPLVLPLVETEWSFKVDCDEKPTVELLESLGDALAYADDRGLDALWIPFRSAVDGGEYNEQHAHMRLFRTRLGWPASLHSRPPTDNAELWDHGYIRHDRSLDEMMQDYLRYWSVGRGNPGWDEHNRLMMYWACTGTANIKGWEYVRSFPWFPQVEAIAFRQEKPWE